MGTTWEELAGIPFDHPDAVRSVDTQVWDQLERLAYDAAMAALVDQGFPCLTIEAVTELTRVSSDLGMLSNVSLDCAADQEWRARWLPALARAARSTLLFDRPLLDGMRELLGHGGTVRFALVAVGEDDDLLHRPIVLLARLDDDPLLVAPCSFTAGRLLLGWIHAESGRRLGTDIGVLGRDADILPSLVEHLTGEEHLVGFW